jgi:hypothetical protein
MRVQIAFDLAANGVGDFFTLDDPTKGQLDDTTYVLAGDVLVDVTDTVRAVQVRRGRSRTLEKFTAGNANVTLDNRNRAYDPTNADSPYFGSITPRKEVRVDIDEQYLFVGNVEDWNFSYSLTGDSVAEPSCVDGMAYIANQLVPAGTAISQATGARVAAILDEVNWPAATRAISTGEATLDADVRDEPVNALDYLNTVSLSEPGAFFISRNGMATFLDRADLQSFSDTGVIFGGTATGAIPFIDIGVVYGTEELYNQVSVVWSAGTAVGGTATASDSASQALYGVIPVTYSTLLDTDTDAQRLADWVVAQYSTAQLRLDSVTVRLDGLTADQKAAVLDLDLGSVAQVEYTPNNAGSAITSYVTIDGIAHAATPALHDVTFTLSQTVAAFILDNAQFGTLDDNVLGY